MTRTAGLALVAALASCTSDSPEPTKTTEPSSTTSPPTTTTAPPPPRFEVGRVLADIDHLAEEIGPRHATSKAYVVAAGWVEGRLERLGYTVARQPVAAPAGNTWGVDVPAGNSPNIVADPPGFDPTKPHRVVGAHLDTVPVAPGAEDNASGVAVLLELARVAAGSGVPVRSSPSAPRSHAVPATTCTTSAPSSYVAGADRAERERSGDGVAGPGRRTRAAGARSAMAAVAADESPRPAAGRGAADPDDLTRSATTTGPATTGRTRRPGCRPSGSAACPTPATTPGRHH